MGRPLSEVLEELQDRGLRLVFSSRIVDPEMRVVVEPATRGLPGVLEEILLPHRLEARRSPSGWLVVVPIEPPETPPADDPEIPPAPVDGQLSESSSRDVLVHDSIVVTPGYSIPVQVLRGGRPLPGLGAADFELFVDGRRQEITAFDVFEVERRGVGATGPVASPVPVAARRHFLLTFDVGSSHSASIARARAAALAALRDAFRPTDLVGVATLSATLGPRIDLGFTDDRRGAEEAIAALGPRATSGHEEDTARARRAVEIPRSPGLAIHAPDVETETREDVLPEGLRADRQSRLHHYLSLAASLNELAQLLGQTPGRKHVVLLSAGFDSSLLFGTTGGSDWEREQIEVMNRAAESGDFWKVDPDRRYGSPWARAQVDEMLLEFVRANCVIQAVDIESGAPWAQHAAARRDGLSLLARRTGGGLYALAGSLGASLAGLLESTSITYLLSFKPPELPADGQFHRLEVRARKGLRNLRIVHQPGFHAPQPYSLRSPIQRQLFIAGRMAAGTAHNDFSSSVRIGPIAAAGPAARIPVVVEVDGATLLATHPGGPLATEIHAYAFARDGAVSGFFSRLLRVEPERLADLRRRGGLRLESTLELPPGDYAVRTLVVNPSVGATSVATAALRVP